MLQGVQKLADAVAVTLGPKVWLFLKCTTSSNISYHKKNLKSSIIMYNYFMKGFFFKVYSKHINHSLTCVCLWIDLPFDFIPNRAET